MLPEIAKQIHENLLKEWRNAGHDLTGRLAKSIEVVPEGVKIAGYMEEYGVYVDTGVKPSQIKHPYAPARIEGLARYGKLRLGLNGKQARRFAYAVATLHKRKGFPLGGATHWIDKAIDKTDLDFVIKRVFEDIEKTLTK